MHIIVCVKASEPSYASVYAAIHGHGNWKKVYNAGIDVTENRCALAPLYYETVRLHKCQFQ